MKKKIENEHVRDFDTLMRFLAEYMGGLADKYKMKDDDMAVLGNTFKLAMAEYSRLVDCGEVPNDRMFVMVNK